MNGVHAVSNLNFTSHYLIPSEQIKKSPNMREIGQETAKLVPNPNDVTFTKDGIVVKVDDKKDKEYEAVIAKYGINIKKIDNPVKALPKPKLTPTGTPIIKYTSKDGEKFMAREVALDNGYKAFAVSNEKNPEQAMLMNKDSFKKLLEESGAKFEDNTRPTFTGINDINGTFGGKDFNIKIDDGFMDRTISGSVDDLNFKLRHNGNFFKDNEITGKIGDEDVSLKVKTGLERQRIFGKIGDEPINLKVDGFMGEYQINGKYKNKKFKIDITGIPGGYALSNDDMCLKLVNKKFLGNDISVQGNYSEEPELIPILVDVLCRLDNRETGLTLAII